MGVVHIRSRVTQDQQAFQNNRLSDRSLLYIERPGNTEPFSLELNIGTRWSEKYGVLDNTMFVLDPEGIDLSAKGSVVVEVADEITVPHNMYGIIVPTGSLFLDKGVIIAAAKVEPSFHGKLKLRLVNTLNSRVRLTPGDKVASVIFFGTETSEFQQTVTKDPAMVRKKPRLTKQAGHWISVNRIQVISWLITIVFSSVSAAIVANKILDSRAASAVPTTSATSTTVPHKGNADVGKPK